MIPYGFYIKTLRVSGNQKAPAEITFGQGLNVVSGASNTGKSYIFQCIDFLLGARKIPKEIEESNGYTIFELEIESYNQNVLTLKRTTTGNKYLIKKGGIDEQLPEEEYFEKLSDDPKNISTLLLSLCGFVDVALKKNQFEKIRLSFRDIAGLTLVDEQQIITEDSPIYSSGESTSKTKEQSLFYFLLTGKDAQDFIEVEDPKILKNKINGKIELVKELINNTQKKLESYKGENTNDLNKAVTLQIDALNLEYTAYLQRIDELKKNINNHSTQFTKRESEFIFKKELEERFLLLRKHYVSDLDRLNFISEGNFLLSQLKNITCPFCGTEINETHFECMMKYEKGTETLEQASKAEVEKINLKLDEINITISNLKEESEKGKLVLQKIQERIQNASAELTETLTPVTTTLKERINNLFKEKLRLEEYNRLRDQITSYTFQLKDLDVLLKQRTQQNKESINMNKISLTTFAKIFEETLNSWKFPNVSSVVFDPRHTPFDIKINNVDRANNGKGIRAITYSAFVVSLMKYCKKNNRPFSYNIVLDSPLTTFKERDKTELLDNFISAEIENSFFENLSTYTQQFQIIILDNKEPLADLKSKINYIHFSGQKGIGRSGFFEN